MFLRFMRVQCAHNLFLSIAESYSVVWIHLVVSAVPGFFISRNKTAMAILAGDSRWGILTCANSPWPQKQEGVAGSWDLHTVSLTS